MAHLARAAPQCPGRAPRRGPDRAQPRSAGAGRRQEGEPGGRRVGTFTRWARELGVTPGAETQELSLRRAGELGAALGVDAGDTIVSVVRLRLLDGRPTMLERLNYTEVAGRKLFEVDLDAVSITEYLSSVGHPIVTLQHVIDAVAADDQDAALLRVPRGTPILRLTRTSRDAEGRIFEASEDRYLSEVVRFTVAASGISTDGHYMRAVGG